MYTSADHSNDAFRENANLPVTVTAFKVFFFWGGGQYGNREDMNNKGEGKRKREMSAGGWRVSRCCLLST